MSAKQEPARNRRKAATSPRERERQLGVKAYDLAEKQMDDGTAAAQVITHFLKAMSSREQLEQERIQMEIELGEQKKQAIAAAVRVEELMTDAIAAFKSYAPSSDVELHD